MSAAKNTSHKCTPTALLVGLGVCAFVVAVSPLLLVVAMANSLVQAFRGNTNPILKILKGLGFAAALFVVAYSGICASGVMLSLLTGTAVTSSLSYPALSVVTVWGLLAVIGYSAVAGKFIKAGSSFLCALGQGKRLADDEVERLLKTGLYTLMPAGLVVALVLTSIGIK